MHGQYEFTGDQNRLINDLSGKMSLVGMFLVLVGVFVGITAVLGFLPLITEVPALPENTPKEIADAVTKYTAFADGSRAQLYYGTLAGALQALILVISGIYTRRASRSFRAIVDTAGRDITNLLEALGALKGLFGILYTLLVLGFLIALGGLGWRLWTQMM